MAKMTPEQKAASKAASQERNKAFNARNKVYRAEQEAAKAAAEQLPEHAAMRAAHEAFERTLEQRNASVQEIDEQIAKLQARREEVRQQHGLAIDAAKETRNSTFSAASAAAKKLSDAVDARFPDMAGCWYPSHWQRPEGI